MTVIPFVASFVLIASDRALFEPSLEMIVYGGGIILVLLVGLAIWNQIGRLRNRQMQHKIDAAHRIAYKTWHRALEVRGTLEPVVSPLRMSPGEHCLWVEENVTLFEVQAVTRSTHTFGTMSVGDSDFRIGRGYSRSEATDEWRPIAKGELYITNRQLYFDGDKQNRKIPLEEIATVKADWSLLEVNAGKREKSMVFSGVNGKICQEIVLAMPGSN